eukprot:6173863-Pleurochrysis_carterae.AAC.1
MAYERRRDNSAYMRHAATSDRHSQPLPQIMTTGEDGACERRWTDHEKREAIVKRGLAFEHETLLRHSLRRRLHPEARRAEKR